MYHSPAQADPSAQSLYPEGFSLSDACHFCPAVLTYLQFLHEAADHRPCCYLQPPLPVDIGHYLGATHLPTVPLRLQQSTHLCYLFPTLIFNGNGSLPFFLTFCMPPSAISLSRQICCSGFNVVETFMESMAASIARRNLSTQSMIVL